LSRWIRQALTFGIMLAVPALLPAQTYEIKTKKSAKGDKDLNIKEELEESTFVLKGPDGKVLNEEKEKKGESSRYTDVILEKEGDKPATKMRRTYEKARIIKDGKTTTLPYEGKTVLIEKKGDKYVFTVDGKELTGDDAVLLNKEFAKEKDNSKDLEEILLPRKAVAVNETWKVDVAAFAKEFGKEDGFAFDLTKATGTGKLLRAYKKDGKQYGVLEFKLEFPIKSLGMGAQKITMQPGSLITFTFLVDACIDGTAANSSMKAEAVMKASGTLTVDGQEFKVTLDYRNTTQESQEELK
jgi:hypothetical protein